MIVNGNLNETEHGPLPFVALSPAALSGMGILWKINRDIFHPLGWSLVVTGEEGDEGLDLMGFALVPSPDGAFSFDPATDDAKGQAWALSLELLAGALERRMKEKPEL